MGRTACHMLNFLGLGMNMTESITFPILLLLKNVGPCFFASCTVTATATCAYNYSCYCCYFAIIIALSLV